MKFINETIAPIEIRNVWQIQNVALGFVNEDPLKYKICIQDKTLEDTRHAVFYLPGLGGTLDDVAYLEDRICPNYPLIRLQNFGLSRPLVAQSFGSFGDVCAIIHNGSMAISSIADRLGLPSYDLVAHSWGGMVSAVNALSDPRCRRAMLLSSSPDICDAVSRMYYLNYLQALSLPLDLIFGKLRWQAGLAKSGKSRHQAAWEKINPFSLVGNSDVELLIFNRAEDEVMLRSDVEHFVEYRRQHHPGVVRAEFIELPGTYFHDMPLEAFENRMVEFLFP